MKYVLLLRGINVGTNNKISMKDLKIWLEEIGLLNVITYLNSGNVVFESKLKKADITKSIEATIYNKYGKNIAILVKSSTDIINIAKSIPDDWKNDATQQTYIAYLFNDIADPKIIEDLPIKRQYIEILYAYEAIIWNIKRENYNKSQITKLASHPSYGKMTTRNVNTARKLAELCKQ